MKILKTVVMCADTGTLFAADTIEYDGKLWIVTAWLQGPTKGTECPARIICLDGLPLKPAGTQYQADYVLERPLSKAFLEGRVIEQGIVALDRPDVMRRVGTDCH
jgi:hypothetical protein